MTTDLMHSRWGWLLLSIALAETANLGLLLTGWLRYRCWSRATSWVRNLQQRPGFSSIQLLYGIGIPAIAYLWQGALTARGMGFQSIGREFPELDTTVKNWATDMGWALLIATVIWVLVTLARLQKPNPDMATRCPGQFLRHAKEAVFYEVHWAFYREPFAVIWGTGVGSWAGALIAALEALTNPGYWSDRDSTSSNETRVLQSTLLIASTLLYSVTQNLWVAISMDLLLRYSLCTDGLQENSASKSDRTLSAAKEFET